MIDELREYIDRGFAVHLLGERSKAPIAGRGWSELPVATFDELKRKYRTGNNVGVRLGKPSKVDGLYLHVIDMDIRRDEYAKEAILALHDLFPKVDQMPVVKSGSGGQSRHFYFLCEEPFRSKKITHSANSFLDADGTKHWYWEIELFGTGKQVVLPPSIHPNGKPYTWLTPFDFDMLDLGIGPVLTVAEIPKAVEVDLPQDDDDLLSLLTPPKGLTLDEMVDVLEALPLDEWCEDRDGWLKTGMAIHHETSGDDEGFDIWCEWSANSSKFDRDDAWRVWKSFRNKASKVTMGTLLKAVKDSGLSYDQCIRKLEKATSYREALAVVAGYDFMPSEVSSLIPRLVDLAAKGGKPVTKKDAEKDLKQAVREANLKNIEKTCRSIEQWLADEVLRIHYRSGKNLISFNDKFWTFDEGCWIVPDQNIIGKHVTDVISQALGSSEDIAEPLRVAIRASGRGESMNAFANAIVGLLRKSCVVGGGDDPLGLCREIVPSVMNCNNTELWFDERSFTSKKHNPDNLFIHKLKVDYDNTAECPEWDKAIDRIFSDKEDREEVIRHLYELMGYILQPTRSHAMWLLFHGGGSNGKSFIVNTICALLGTKAWTAHNLADYSSGRNAHVEAGLVGKLLMVDDDFRKGALLPDDILKKFSEAKHTTANPKFGDEFNFKCRVTPIVLANHWPKTSDSSYGLERRAMVFDFTVRITNDEKDPLLEERIKKNELPGILNHCIAGWRRVMERGRFIEPESCVGAKSRWLRNRNAVSLFASEQLEITANDADRVPAIDLWATFYEWCDEENSGRKWGRNTFYDELTNLNGVTRHKVDGAVRFHGIRLKKLDSLVDLI